MTTYPRTLALTVALGLIALAVGLIMNTEDASRGTPDSKSLPSASSGKQSSVTASSDSQGGPIRRGDEIPGTSAGSTPSPSTPAGSRGNISPSTAPRAGYQPPPSKYKNARNPIARRALAGVGSDSESERVWMEAINDPNLPADERQDLIEDLNEDGISDPAKPTERDLPLIKSRISLIEQLSPSAMDQTNAAAFKEAHKDLVNMVKRLER